MTNFIHDSSTLLNFTNMKNILLVGCGGKTGDSYMRLLLQKNKTVFAYDKNIDYKIPDELSKHVIRVADEEFNNSTILNKMDGVTLSPGVPLQQKIFYDAIQKNISVFSELEFSCALLDNPFITVTGTDGKSTVTALIEHLLKGLDREAVACGNFGLPLSALATSPTSAVLSAKNKIDKQTVLVAELSSYQLELCRNLQSDVALFLNLAADHLNRYKSFDDYALTKWKIAFSLKKNGSLCVEKNLLEQFEKNNFEEYFKEYFLAEQIPAKIFTVDSALLQTENFFWQEENCFFAEKKIIEKETSAENKSEEKYVITTVDEFPIKGKHNQINLLFALQAVYSFLEQNTKKINVSAFAQKTRMTLKKFHGLAHRFEIVPSNDGNVYINDSKATTTQAVLAALKNVEAPCYVFLGGKGKGENYKVLAQPLKDKNVFVITFGEIAEVLKLDLQDHVMVIGSEKNLQAAFDLAQKHYAENTAPQKATFLLSPAATSWDAFASFEHRGDFFKELVGGLG